jgi:DNA-binding response OmpR family regulator
MVMPDTNYEILLIEDHQDIAEMVSEYLEARGFNVDYAADGITGLHLCVTNDYDAIILDLTLPGMDGLDVCSKLRNEASNQTPILMLTARDTLADKLSGLNMGADDYLVKPFEIEEMEARIRALIRRNRGQVTREVLEVDELILDMGTLRVTRAGQTLDLAPISLKILSILMRESPNVVSRRAIEKEIWGDVLPDTDTLRSHLYNLRKVIDKPFAYPLLYTVQRTGYRLARPDA